MSHNPKTKEIETAPRRAFLEVGRLDTPDIKGNENGILIWGSNLGRFFGVQLVIPKIIYPPRS